jgi:hypothetical protein
VVEFTPGQKMGPSDGATLDKFGQGGGALSGDGSVFSACSYGENDGGYADRGSCWVCDRADSVTHFVWGTDCHKLVPSDGAGNDAFGFGGPALSSDGLVFSACSYGDDDNSASGSGSCYVCDRADTTTDFVWATDCHKLLPSDGAAGDEFGYNGPALSNDGLVFSACSYKDDDNSASDSGSCYVCDRVDTATDFVWTTDCHKLVPSDGATDDRFGFGGVALSADGLVFSACSHNDDDNGTNNSGSCWVCDRADIATDFVWATDCHKLVTSDGANSDYFGMGGPALSGHGLVFSACSKGDDDMGSSSGSCWVCDRADTTTDFVWATDCYKLVASDAEAYDEFGSNGGPALSSNGLVFSACSHFDDDNSAADSGSCWVCNRADTTTDFVWATDCHKLVPSDGANSDYFGMGGPALSNDGLVFSACSHFDDDNSAADSGSCWVYMSPVPSKYVCMCVCACLLVCILKVSTLSFSLILISMLLFCLPCMNSF